MSNLRETADLFDKIIKDTGITKYKYTVTNSEKRELNLEAGDFKLFRTVFSNSGSIKVFKDNKIGSASGNDISEEGLKGLASDALAAAESSPEDPAHDIGPKVEPHVFKQGVLEPDIDKFIERIKELLATIEKEYPLVKVFQAVGSYDRWNWFSRNSNGTEFEGYGGQYGVMIEVCASDGENTTGMDGAGVSMINLDTPIIELGDIRNHLADIEKSIKPDTVEGKFDGTVIITPACAADFISMVIGNYISDGVIIDGTSQWLDKVGEQVASDKLTVRLDPFDERINIGERATSNGFLSEAVTLIDKGVLKTHFLSLYAANKTGRPLVKNTGFDLIIEPGDKNYEEILAGVKKGLILGRFSGGSPGTNGEFSGVAKNSFLVEDGKIKNAVAECMISGNLGDVVKNISTISKEQICDGGTVVPYIAVEGIVISGK
ncbi:MAG: TldD/PmbA family protein [Lachnospiraceae bacterium]|nr:TldD/PmbA family protein [Lachnospiraceae bacterium]